MGTALLLLAPAAAALAVFSLYPLVESFRLSGRRLILALPALGSPSVGLANFAELAADPVARRALATTFVFVAVSTAAELCLGLVIALAINERFPGRGALRACVLIPWAVPTVVASQMWRFLWNDQYGLINYALYGGHLAGYRAWLATPAGALGALIVADVWKTSSFAALLILAGLQLIPPELYEAARIDGAGRWQRFRHVTLPLVKPALLLALLFRTVDAFRVFDLAFVMTQGGPADATTVLQLYGWRQMFAEGMVGYGAAVSVVVFLLALGVSLLYLGLFGSRLLRGAA
jgi:multiple sugar transport system permease protein